MPGLTVADHLRMGRWLNPGWDGAYASRRIEELGLALRQRAGTLSGGQRAQLALTLAVAKRPELLLLDEPVAALDPLARREFLQTLMEVVAEHGISIVLSSHLIADLERVCDHLIVLSAGRVLLDGEVDELLATHHRLIGPRRDPGRLPSAQTVIEQSHADKQTTLLVRAAGPVLDPAWTVTPVTLDDLVLAYLRQARDDVIPVPAHLAADRMIRLAWRQSRTQTLLAVGLVVALAIAAAVTGVQLSHLYADLVAHCRTSCDLATTRFLSHDRFMDHALDILAQVVPALFGVFWARRWSPANSRRARSGWRGRRACRGRAGWAPSSRSAHSPQPSWPDW